MSDADPLSVLSTYLRLRGDGDVEQLPVGASFWERLAGGALGSFEGEYLVSCYPMESDWRVWERHPNGDEVVCLLSGDVTFVVDDGDRRHEQRLGRTGDFLVVPRGRWHTARVAAPSTVLFVTPGEGTEHRPVDPG